MEAVLHYAKKRPGFKVLKQAGSPVSFVYLAWESATRPIIKLHRKNEIEAGLAAFLAEFFNQDGIFHGRLPEDLLRLAELSAGRDDFQVGDDALRYARQCADDAAQAQCGRQISQEILRANGMLPGIKVRLFPYQNEGVAFLASRGRALLADNEGVRKVLVICPSLKQQ